MADTPTKHTEKHTETHECDCISRQAAVDAIEEYSDRLQMVNWKENPGVPYKAYALNWCINTIRELPSVQSEHSQNTPQKQPDLETFGVKTGETCADAISRQEVIEIFTQLWDCVGEIADRDEWEDVCRTTANELPSAQRKGKWIATQEWGGRNYSCSCCKFSFIVDTCMLEPMWNYCPNCGAEMKGEEDETN